MSDDNNTVIFLPASPASCTHKFGKGLTILKSMHPGMQQIQIKVFNFTLEDSCFFVWDSLFCNFVSPRTRNKNL